MYLDGFLRESPKLGLNDERTHLNPNLRLRRYAVEQIEQVLQDASPNVAPTSGPGD